MTDDGVAIARETDIELDGRNSQRDSPTKPRQRIFLM
jgi:hypothetical protein